MRDVKTTRSLPSHHSVKDRVQTIQLHVRFIYSFFLLEIQIDPLQ